MVASVVAQPEFAIVKRRTAFQEGSDRYQRSVSPGKIAAVLAK
jgi:hypothetical protein